MEQTYSTKQIIITLGVVLSVILIFYGITILINDNKKEEPIINNDSTEIQYSEIIVGDIYNQKENEYYVLAYTDSSNSQTYISKANEYIYDNDSNKLYFINLINAFNKKYLSTESNFENKFPTFKGNTLLKISNGSIVEIYEAEQITDKIDELINEE